MLFLAISGILLLAAILAVGGQEAHTEFTTSMNDINTKFQQWIDDVVNGATGSTAGPSSSASNFDCTISGSGQPQLVKTGGAGAQRGANPDCIFLGKAIQVHSGQNSAYSDKIYAYTILGRRLSALTGQLVSNVVQAQPAAAISGGVDLTETYQIENGARILSVKSGPNLGDPSPSLMAGFITSFNSETSPVINGSSTELQNGSQSLLALQYPMSDNNAAPESQEIQDCIGFLSTTCSPPPNVSLPFPLQEWQICFGSTRNNDQASLTLTSTQGRGVVTNLAFDQCYP